MKTSKNIHCFIGCDKEYEESQTVIFGAPFDGTTSYRPGTRFASSAIRNESFAIETYSPYQDKDLENCKIFDGGDLELSFGNVEKTLNIIEQYTSKIINENKIPCMIGGEHLVSLGAIKAVANKHKDLHIIHFDAHADLRENYLGEKLSHATVIRRIWEILGDGKIHQYAIRSGEKVEFEFAKNHTTMQKFDFEGIEKLKNQLKNKPVYLTIDLDVLDSSVFCGTGTPEAGGVTFKELISAMLSLKDINIVGCDITELSPILDQSGASTSVACKTLRELLLLINK